MAAISHRPMRRLRRDRKKLVASDDFGLADSAAFMVLLWVSTELRRAPRTSSSGPGDAPSTTLRPKSRRSRRGPRPRRPDPRPDRRGDRRVPGRFRRLVSPTRRVRRRARRRRHRRLRLLGRRGQRRPEDRQAVPRQPLGQVHGPAFREARPSPAPDRKSRRPARRPRPRQHPGQRSPPRAESGNRAGAGQADASVFEAQNGPQRKFLKTRADIAIYGGAAGGGKTWALLLEAMRASRSSRISPPSSSAATRCRCAIPAASGTRASSSIPSATPSLHRRRWSGGFRPAPRSSSPTSSTTRPCSNGRARNCR